MVARPPTRHWDLFCSVVDNLGDAGIAWRLARQLVHEHGLQVTLWIDVPAALAGMAGVAAVNDNACIAGVTIRSLVHCDGVATLPDVIVEVLGCGLPERYGAAVRARATPPRWFILEYLSAESWVEDMHGKPSPDPPTGIARRFWFPGFTVRTGGVLRERDLVARREAFLADANRQAAMWRALGVAALPREALRISLFCYAHAPVAQVFDAWSRGGRTIACFVPDGVANTAMTQWCRGRAPTFGDPFASGALTLHRVPFVTQDRYDELLWACDFNFVRGEDSFVRAQWAGHPFAWHIYRQDEAAHHPKLAAFLDRYEADMAPDAAMALRTFWRVWNGVEDPDALAPAWDRLMDEVAGLSRHARTWRDDLARLPDLAQTLVKAASDKV